MINVKERTKLMLTKSSFDEFLNENKRIEEQSMINPKAFQRLLQVKKLFSVPWLLAHDFIFDKQDFLRRVFKPRVSKAKR